MARAVVIALTLLPLSGQLALCQSRTLDLLVSSYKVQDADLGEALRYLVAQTNGLAAVGVERVSESNAATQAGPKMSLHIEQGTVAEILKQICSHDGRYTFADAGEGVINVFPIEQSPESKALLSLPLRRVDISRSEWPGNLFGRIREFAPDLDAYLTERQRKYLERAGRVPHGTPGAIMSTNVAPPRIEIHLGPTTVRDALNAIAAYTLTHVLTNEAGATFKQPSGWEFRLILDQDADTGLGGYPHWGAF